jgi:hypothetical protein
MLNAPCPQLPRARHHQELKSCLLPSAASGGFSPCFAPFAPALPLRS